MRGNDATLIMATTSPDLPSVGGAGVIEMTLSVILAYDTMPCHCAGEREEGYSHVDGFEGQPVE